MVAAGVAGGGALVGVTVRLVAAVEYDGSGFSGWQRQRHTGSVQEAVERAISRVADEAVEVTCAGRTDAGVHATGQVIHFDSGARREERAWVMGGNSHLPDSVRLLWVRPIDPDFHARFSALARGYRYVILSRPLPSALHRQRVAWTYKPLDAARMHEAGQALLGEHDFSAFRAAGCQARHAVRRISRLQVSRHGDYLYLDIEANAFLHHMVRNIAGSLMAIGAGEQPLEWIGEVLAGRDRTLAAATGPAAGLYLVKVSYPERYRLPCGGELPAFA